MASEEELVAARRKHVEALGAAGVQPYPNDFQADEAGRREVIAIANDEARRAQLPGEGELPEGAKRYPLYGRVTAKRGPFVVIATPYGTAQALVRPENLAENEAAQLKALDLADHIAVWGPLLKTKTGALTVKVERYRHLSKALLPPPDKWHGLADVEKRYRERYVDLFANPDVGAVFRARSAIMSALRAFLAERDFLEVETPVLHPVLGGATARPFHTHHNALDIPLYLRIAPELYLKRLIVGGFDRVFEVARTFRNEGVSTRHNPEFTMVELYMAYATYEDLITLTEQLIRAVDAKVREHFPKLTENRPFTLSEPFARATMRETIARGLAHAGEGRTKWSDVLKPEDVGSEAAVEEAFTKMMAVKVPPDDRKLIVKARTYGDRIAALFELVGDPLLPQLYRSKDSSCSLPVFVTEHPVEVSPLARRSESDPRFTDRFELFVEHREIANAFSELNDPDDQAARFHAQLDNKARGDDEAMEFDHDYIRALQHGMPPTAGLGIGVDRFVMLLCGQPSIRDVLLFPLLKPEPHDGE